MSKPMWPVVARSRPCASRSGSREAGHALLLALVVLLLVSAALSLVAASLQFQVESSKRQVVDANLVALSDGAMAETLARLDQKPDFLGFETRPLGDGLVASQVVALTSRTYIVSVQSTFGGKEHSVLAEVRRTDEELKVTSWRRLPVFRGLPD